MNFKSEELELRFTYASRYDLESLNNYVRAVLYKLIKLKKEYDFNSSKELKEYIDILKLGDSKDLESKFN